MVEKDESKIVSVEFLESLESDIPEVISGTRVGDEYVRPSNEDIHNHPSIAALTKEGDKINIVWLIIKRSGELLSEGQELYARVRVSKRTGGFAIAATTVTLGVIVAVKVIQRSKDEH